MREKKPSILTLLVPYKGLLIVLILLSFLGNSTSLVIPKIVAGAIDSFNRHVFQPRATIYLFFLVAFLGLIFTYLQNLVQTYVSEKVARDLRTDLSNQISRQSHAYVEGITSSKLLTNLTADVDSIKLFVSQAFVSILSSVFIIVGASFLLLSLNWRLGLAIIATIPLIGTAFYLVLKQVRTLFIKSREVIDLLNKVINESILGSALIRVIHCQQLEFDKFFEANVQAKNLGLSILKLFAGLIPVIVFISSMASFTILLLGGHFVIQNKMSLGEFTAFNSYLALLIFPILIIGFMSSVIAQASASYERIYQVLHAPEAVSGGPRTDGLKGWVEFKEVSVFYGQKPALKNISFKIEGGTKVAIIGPTAAGKTQLLYLLTGLIQPDQGVILLDGVNMSEFNDESFHNQVGFVFQDSIIFNMSLRENIAFSEVVTEASLIDALNAAELKDYISGLPEGLDTEVSERGTNLSGGQKQRIMLARALALRPVILLLDDFTARVDASTEAKILRNIEDQYPGLTLITVTQKISAVEAYDKIIVLMQGELVAEGRHEDLLRTSPEYVQIYNSQQSVSSYELQS